MDSIDSRLTENETIVYRTKCHWAVLLGPILVIIIGTLALPSQGYHALALIAFGLVWGFFGYSDLRSSEIGVTQKRVLINGGFPRKKQYDIPIGEIISLEYYQPSLGAMLYFGKITLVSKGRRRLIIRFVTSPAQLVGEVQQQMNALNPVPTQK